MSTRRFLWAAIIVAAIVLASPGSAQRGFTPCTGTQPSLSVSNVSSNVQLGTCGGTAILYNNGSQEAFYVLGSASNTAATTSNSSLPGNTFVVLSVPVSFYLAAITSASTTTIRVVQGSMP